MHTIEEATKLWCPHIRLTRDDIQHSYNRCIEGGLIKHTACIADRCMAWRWQIKDETPEQMAAMFPPPKRIYRRTDRGYCGLAGSSPSETGS